MDHYDFIIKTVRDAGVLLMRLREEKFETLEKGGDPRDIVTSVDLAVNDFIIGKIRDSFPEDAIYSEEGGGTESGKNSWAIDPIDGTFNFSRSIPYYAICIACLTDGVSVAGAVYNPITDELFSFKKGGGAFLNGKPIAVSKVSNLKDAAVFFRAGRKPELWEWGGASYAKLLAHAKRTSNYGGSALDTCFVAAGRIEANIYGRLTTMDIAAAIGILYEAGGRIVNNKGESVVLSTEPQTVVMANNEAIEKEILALLF
ncbi:MAG: myo-inositol-1(or 4)-monophosphatase [Parcubacteria group bacterium Gr01-1014_91]|nr:MAG: myo-inositol-1(or 4)-monophosphatase [Parcubacteria group bacterium Gr01-1014_91]